MKDMLDQEINPGDLFLMPGGNARFGGLVLEVGIVLSMTDKRLKTLVTRFDKIKTRNCSKTPQKILKINFDSSILESNEAISILIEEYKVQSK